MKILTNKKYEKMRDLITTLQQDFNDLNDDYDKLGKDYKKLNDKQVDLQLELKYMQEQKELAEKQVKYLQDELRIANDIKKPTKCKCESALFVEQKDGQYKLATEETIKNAKRGRKPRKEKEDGTKGKNVQKK